ncbi:glycosyltransferase family 2 protein [Microvirga rosea]|uniref:glycosyltransferase family 2 protein n=1 Tax=Microvirga rosea TaxID=2715425 RepID=UPI001D09F636|nr:glycosyltransferase [Microvirga rosea]MCB8818940.1 glycosyltransferase [Microvirga rosea]
MPEVAIIIPHYKDVLRLEKCLQALALISELQRCEVVVVDNNSEIDLSLLQLRHPAVRFINEATQGAAASRNRGVRETTAPLLFFLDSDCIPRVDWIPAGIVALTKADIVGGSIDLFDETDPPRNGTQVFESVFAFKQKQYIEKQHFSVTANLLTWRRVFDDVGGFRSGVSEDVDWCHRAVREGYTLVYDENVRVGHPTRNNMGELTRKWKRMVQERFELQSQEPYARARWALRALLVLFSPIVDIRRIVLSDRVNGHQEILRGIGVLCHLRFLRFVWMMKQVFSMAAMKQQLPRAEVPVSSHGASLSRK